MNKGLISGLVLLVIGLVCGVLLAFVNSFTAPIIKENADKVVLESLGEVYEGASNYTLDEVEGGNNVDKLFFLKDKTSGDTVAIIYSVQAEGYQSTISMLIAIEVNGSNEFVVAGYKVVSQAETSGIGDKIVGYDFEMEGEIITDLTAFDGVAGPSAIFSKNAVRACFVTVGERVAADFGGAN